MPRRNRRRYDRPRQHPKKQRASRRPRGWHRKHYSSNVVRAVRWLEGQA